MQFFISLFLLGLVLLLPLYAGASVLRWALDSFGRLFDKSLVQHRDSVRAAQQGSGLRNTLLAWALTLGGFVVLVVGLPRAPEVEYDQTRILVERLYATGLSALKLEHAESLLHGLSFNSELVRTLCKGIPEAVQGSHRFTLDCVMLQNAIVSVRVLDRGVEVLADTWVVP